MKNKSSIGIFVLTFNRLKHLKKIINALSKYTKSNEVIYIFADNSNFESSKVNLVHKYIQTLNPKKFKTIIRNKNLGLKENWFKAYDFMFKKYDKVICLEDDTLINKNFMKFMREKLIFYKNDKKIMSITGYAHPIKLPRDYKYDIFFSQRPNSWGQASWKRVWKLFKKNKENNLDILLNKKNLLKLSNGGNDLVDIDYQLVSDLSGECFSNLVYNKENESLVELKNDIIILSPSYFQRLTFPEVDEQVIDSLWTEFHAKYGIENHKIISLNILRFYLKIKTLRELGYNIYGWCWSMGNDSIPGSLEYLNKISDYLIYAPNKRMFWEDWMLENPDCMLIPGKRLSEGRHTGDTHFSIYGHKVAANHISNNIQWH